MLTRWPALYMLVVFTLVFIYRFGPDREHDHLGQRLGRPCLDRGFGLVLLVRDEFR